MKLLLFVCVCALAAADQQEVAPTVGQLAVGLGHLYRRFLHVVAPKQLELQDALEMKYENGMMASPPFTSYVKGTFDGHEHSTFSCITSLANPGQKSIADDGPWVKQDTCDIIITHHYGGAMKIHMFTVEGIYKEVIVGNPLKQKKANFVAVVPKAAYFILESLSEEKANFHSYVSVPAWDQASSEHFSNKYMEAKFPEHAELFHDLDKPGVHHEHDDHHDSHHDDHDHEDRGHGHDGKRHGHGGSSHRRH